MTRFALISFLALFATACTEVPPPPDGGTGGAGGSAGVSGMGGGGDAGVGGVGGQTSVGGTGGIGSGGSGGVGGSSNAGAGGMGGLGGDPCAVVVPKRYANLEASDVVQREAAVGYVNGMCPGLTCEGDDPIDQWSITTCGGDHRVRLWWDTPANNLSLFVFTPDDSESWSSQGTSVPEVISEELTAGQEYIIQVQAVNTNDDAQAYDVTVTPMD